MFCKKCGTQIPDSAVMCAVCRTPVDASAYILPPSAPKPPSPFRSGNDPAAIDQIRGWNWGAFLAPLIWSAYHDLWIFTLSTFSLPFAITVGGFIISITRNYMMQKQYPYLIFVFLFINIAIRIYLGTNGNILAWKTQPFENVAKFRKSQRELKTVGVLLFLCIPILFVTCAPGFLGARDRGRYSAAKETLVSVQTAVNKVEVDNPGTLTGTGPYSNAVWGKNNLCKEMLSNDKCTDDGKGASTLKSRISQSVSNFSLTISSNGETYTIKGRAMDKWRCKICVTPNGVFPIKYTLEDCAKGTCP